jgi:hypothetical protein
LRRYDIGYITIDTLPDDVLLEIFKFYVCEDGDGEDWEELVHVCRRWRYVAFAAPRSLDMRLVSTASSRAREMIDIWPALPILVLGAPVYDETMDNIVAALERNDRVCEIFIKGISHDALEALAAMTAMQNPFPALTHFYLGSPVGESEIAPVLPDSFLGGSAPSLQSFFLDSIPFPALPKLLSSACHLVRLELGDIPSSVYLSPKAMVECLSALTRLEKLKIDFRSALPLPVRADRHPPHSPTVLPALTSLSLRSGSEYVGDFFTWMRVPPLDHLDMSLLRPAILNVRGVSVFTGRVKPFEGLDQAHVLFKDDFIEVMFSPRNGTTGIRSLTFSFKFLGSVWQFWSLTHSKRRFSTSFYQWRRFDVCDLESRCSPLWVDNMANARWLEFLGLFNTAEDLYLSAGAAMCVAPALRELAGTHEGGTGTNVLHRLRNLFVEGLSPSGPVREAIAEFVARRQLSGHPIDVQHWLTKF